MSPKARSTQVITHRIELQETERATLEAALAGRFVTNSVGALGSVFSGIGSALAPFSGAFTALTALWIADKTFDEIKEIAGNLKDKAVEVLFPQLGTAQEMYSFIVGWLQAQHGNGGYSAIMANDYEVTEHLTEQGAYPFLINAFREFMRHIRTLYSARHLPAGADPLEENPGGRAWHNFIQTSPSKWWISFYTVQAYAQDIYRHEKATHGLGVFGSWDLSALNVDLTPGPVPPTL